LLAKPETQWKAGYSAYELAHCWEAANGFPPTVEAALESAPSGVFSHLELLLGLPEHKVSLPGGDRPSQNDLWVLARNRPGELVSIAVEGKVAESFGDLIPVWREKDGGPSDGKLERLSFLCSALGLGGDDFAHIRYQLLRRTASSLIEADDSAQTTLSCSSTRSAQPMNRLVTTWRSPRHWGDGDTCDRRHHRPRPTRRCRAVPWLGEGLTATALHLRHEGTTINE
jgi:hypothetical protein